MTPLELWRYEQHEDRVLSSDYAFTEFLAKVRYRQVRHERPRTLRTLEHLAATYPAWQLELYRHVNAPSRRVDAIAEALRNTA
jgi:hypothetical protein